MVDYDHEIVEPRMVCECANSKNTKFKTFDVLILGVTPYGVSFVPVVNHRIYSDISGSRMTIFDNDGDWYIAFDRVYSRSWDDFYKIFSESYEKLTYADFSRVVYTIHQFNIGDIVWNKYINKFSYREDYQEVKNTTLEIRISNIKYTHPDHPVSLGTLDDSETDPLDFEEMEAIDNSIYDDNVDISNLTSDRASMIEVAKIFDIPIKIEHDDVTGEDKVLFDLIKYRKPKNKKNNKVEPSEPRTKDKHKKEQYKRRWFTEEEVNAIATKMDRGSVASKYECSTDIATDMIRNARRILKLAVDTRSVENRFSCYFNEGKTVEDVCKIYPNLKPSMIESQYNQWLLNENAPNNENVRNYWKDIFERDDIEVMQRYVFYKVNTFAAIQRCTPSTAEDILYKIFDRLSINPYLCAGFGVEAFDIENLMYTIDIIRNKYNPTSEEKSIIERFDIVRRLEKAYRDSYHDHASIKAGLKDIPDTVMESDRDYFMSLIWNRFSKSHIITSKRELSENQKFYIKAKNKHKTSLYFMIQYSTAEGIVNRYKSKV